MSKEPRRHLFEGRPVVDARRPIILHVTKADTTRGTPKEASSCPAARSLRREKGTSEARVHVTRSYFLRPDGQWERYVTPADLRMQLVLVDKGVGFEPGEYRLMPASEHQRLGAGYGGKTTKNNKTGRTRRSPHYITGIRKRAP